MEYLKKMEIQRKLSGALGNRETSDKFLPSDRATPLPDRSHIDWRAPHKGQETGSQVLTWEFKKNLKAKRHEARELIRQE
ncbi:MAG: hypothetical protein NPIRA06_10520 [Nitrospirales bacterium]|nr:MAG: hypothetical protein NPIRA06_10520 [Nitrospirales bacterium]